MVPTLIACGQSGTVPAPSGPLFAEREPGYLVMAPLQADVSSSSFVEVQQAIERLPSFPTSPPYPFCPDDLGATWVIRLVSSTAPIYSIEAAGCQVIRTAGGQAFAALGHPAFWSLFAQALKLPEWEVEVQACTPRVITHCFAVKGGPTPAEDRKGQRVELVHSVVQ
jgi:hypothetical protein